MKRLLQCAFTLVLLFSFFTFFGGSVAHASARKANDCENWHWSSINIYATKGHVGDYLGYIQIEADGCGDGQAWAYPTSGTYVNHLWVEYVPGTLVSSDFGGGTGSRKTGFWETSQACAGGIFQNGSDWGGGDTSCIQTTY